jgi:hypothetical protein
MPLNAPGACVASPISKTPARYQRFSWLDSTDKSDI